MIYPRGTLLTILCSIGRGSLGVPVALFGKFSMAGAFAVAYLYTAELFPTQVRNQALGVVSVGARLGGILSPIVIMTVSFVID